MVKSQLETLGDLKALYIVAVATMPQEERKYYTLALLAVSAQWGLEEQLSRTIYKMETAHNDNFLPLSLAH